jgi:hypothetical protein
MGLAASRLWQNYDVMSRGDGSATMRIKTARQLDRGEPILREEVNLEFDSLEQALDSAGTSRINPAGVIVTVRLDGEERVG